MKKDTVAFIAVILGIAAIPMSMAIIPGIILGVISITLGIISRINTEHFNLQNILGIVFGCIAIFLSGVVFLGTIMLLKDPEVMAQLSEIMSMYYR